MTASKELLKKPCISTLNMAGWENCLPSASYWQVLNWTGIDVPARKIDQNIPIFGRLKGPSSLWSLLGGVESGRGPTEGVFSS